MQQVAAPTPDDLGLMIGRPADVDWSNGVARMMLSTATQLASAYCHGEGFGTDDQGNALVPADLFSVILLRAVRLTLNYSQLLSESTDNTTMNYGAASQGWTLEEQRTLNAYRVTAA